MTQSTHLIAGLLEEALGTEAPSIQEERGEPVLRCGPHELRRVVRTLKEHPQLRFIRLVDITGVDYLFLGTTPRFSVVYHLHSFLLNTWLRLKVPLEEGEDAPSIADLYPAASWYEREVFDMFGIRFTGHPNLQRILMPDDWAGHPLRKDYPLGAERIPFTHHLKMESSDG
jgi:NADH-quinone oxidoreductase subunit C